MPVLCFLVIKKRLILTESSKIEELEKKFKVLFKEFNSAKKENLWFYYLFFIRRLFISMIIFIIASPVLCLVLSFCLSAMVKIK